jgi:hypothetical protein
VGATAEKTDPALWEKVKDKVTQGDRGGRPGQWSARKAQLAVHLYKQQGGGYAGPKDPGNHLRKWTKEDWGTASGEKSSVTGERYLPKRTRAHLSKAEYAKTTAKKKADTSKGRQFSAQPKAIGKKTARDRRPAVGSKSNESEFGFLTRVDLVRRAADAGIAGRSRMSKAQLLNALGS